MIDLGSGQSTGTVMISSSEYGAVFTPTTRKVYLLVHMASMYTPMVHAKASPKMAKSYSVGLRADIMTQKTGKHGFPWTDDNHLGVYAVALHVNTHGIAVNRNGAKSDVRWRERQSVDDPCRRWQPFRPSAKLGGELVHALYVAWFSNLFFKSHKKRSDLFGALFVFGITPIYLTQNWYQSIRLLFEKAER